MKKTKEIISYIIFGVLTTAVSWGSYTLFVNTFKINIFWSNFLSWVCAIIFAFVTNKLWVFDSKSWNGKLVIKELTSFVASRGATGVLEIFLVPAIAKLGFDNIFYSALTKLSVSAEILFTNGIYSKISVAFIVVVLNYVFSKLFVFKKKEEK